MENDNDEPFYTDKTQIEECLNPYTLQEDEKDEWIPHTHSYKGTKLEDGWEKLNINWCDNCSKTYHSVCEDGIEQLKEMPFSGKFGNSKKLSDIDYNTMEDICINYGIENENKITKLREKIREVKTYNQLSSKCSKYRKSQHSQCYRFKTDKTKNKGDIDHEHFINTLNSIRNKCSNTYKKLNKKLDTLLLSKEKKNLELYNFSKSTKKSPKSVKTIRRKKANSLVKRLKQKIKKEEK